MERTEKFAYLSGAQDMLDAALTALGEGRGTSKIRNELLKKFSEVSRAATVKTFNLAEQTN